MAVNGAIPTFFLNEQVINTESDICAYLLKFLFWNPGSTSNQIEETLLSMRKMSATYAEDINTFPAQLQLKLTEALNRYNTGWKSEIEVIERNEEAKTYGLRLKILDNSGINILTTDSLMIKDGYLTIRNEMEDTGTYNNSRSPRHAESSYSDINVENAKALKVKRDAQRAAEQMQEIRNKDYQTTDAESKAKELKNIQDNKSFIDELTATATEANKRQEILDQLNKDKPNYGG